MLTAMRVVLRNPECNHMKFSKEKPDGAIIKIMDKYECQKEVKGSWWLVEGPDLYG